jgi:4-hydroxybenzoate polyprenyltransferase
VISVASLRPYIELTRLYKPIGILLLLWPVCWALWLAAGGLPPISILLVFVCGVVLMRSAGCIINDIFDRHYDRHVQRTRLRPLAAGTLNVRQALALAITLALMAFLLVLFCNRLTILLSFAGAFLAVCYPLLKRVTHLPQLGLGVAFSWGVPMAFAAVMGEVTLSAWLVFAAAAIWPVIYDTMYAMTDRADDIRIGVKSTAILFGRYDVFIIACLMLCFIALLMLIGFHFQLNYFYFIALGATAVLLFQQLLMIRHRDPQKCFQAFLQNNYVGLVIFAGVVVGLN